VAGGVAADVADRAEVLQRVLDRLRVVAVAEDVRPPAVPRVVVHRVARAEDRIPRPRFGAGVSITMWTWLPTRQIACRRHFISAATRTKKQMKLR
jgi:hypothetical protein